MSHFLFLETRLWSDLSIFQASLKFRPAFFSGWMQSIRVYQFLDQEEQSSLRLRVCGCSEHHGPYNRTFMPTQRWISLAVNLSDVNISKRCSIYADNDCMCLRRREWIVKLRCHIDNIIPDSTAASHPVIALHVLLNGIHVFPGATWGPYKKRVICMAGQQGRVSGRDDVLRKTQEGHQIWMSQFHKPSRVKLNIWCWHAHVSQITSTRKCFDSVSEYLPPGELLSKV